MVASPYGSAPTVWRVAAVRLAAGQREGIEELHVSGVASTHEVTSIT